MISHLELQVEYDFDQSVFKVRTSLEDRCREKILLKCNYPVFTHFVDKVILEEGDQNLFTRLLQLTHMV